MGEFVLFCVPSVLYALIRTRRGHGSLRPTLARVGATWGALPDYGRALLLLIPLLLLGWASLAFIPAGVADRPGVSVGLAGTTWAAVSVALRASGEEIFFRGLMGGVLCRRWGFARGNLAQATCFLLPHLALLLVDVRLWPILPAQFVAGWLLGWLRHTSGSFVPCAVVHAAVNLTAGLLTA